MKDTKKSPENKQYFLVQLFARNGDTSWLRVNNSPGAKLHEEKVLWYDDLSEATYFPTKKEAESYGDFEQKNSEGGLLFFKTIELSSEEVSKLKENLNLGKKHWDILTALEPFNW